MLTALHIKNYILIDSLDIEFPESLVVISGPTGAGKSILIGALGLLLGAKADAASIAPGAETCVVEGEFGVADSEVEDICRENDLDYASGHLTVRRVLSKSGRLRSFVNDEPCAVSVLERIGRRLVDIHNQHDTLLLKDSRYQMSVLDSFAGNGELLERCASRYSALKKLKAGKEELERRILKAENESFFNAAMLEKLEKAAIREGEIASLEAEQYALSHSEQIKELLSASASLLSPDSSEEDRGINRMMSDLCHKLKALAAYYPDFADMAERAEQSRIELKDVTEGVIARNESVSCSPERLQWVDDRLSVLYDLLKRFSAEDERQLIQKRDDLRKETFALDELRDELKLLNEKSAEAESEWSSAADELRDSRERNLGAFAEEIMKDLKFMELDKAVFRAALSDGCPGPEGRDTVEFLFSSVPSLPPAPVARCASGGELSRIMLSIKDVMCRYMKLPALVFDEIDTGVSGSVADEMGRIICNMGQRMQVFAITHLPQVAAKGKAHYLVEKTEKGSSIRKLSTDERVAEVARMLSGEKLTPEALANAKSLMGS